MSDVFMVGEQRSGSNLLRLMLASGGFAAPHPAHVLSRVTPLLPRFGDLQEDRNWERLVDTCCTLVERNPVPWAPLESLDRAVIAAGCRDRSLVAVFGALMDAYAQANGRSRWACKSMGVVNFLDELERYFEAPRYVYLYRDPRDVTLSFTKAVVGEKHPYLIASRWAERQRACLAAGDRLGPERFHGLSYEALTSDPRGTLTGLCRFLGIEFREEMLEGHASSAAASAAGRSQLWENLDRPVMKSNTRKYLSGLQEAEIRMVEVTCADVMERLGYEREFEDPAAGLDLSPAALEAYAAENERLKGLKREEMDPEDRARRRLQLSTLEELAESAP